MYPRQDVRSTKVLDFREVVFLPSSVAEDLQAEQKSIRTAIHIKVKRLLIDTHITDDDVGTSSNDVGANQKWNFYLPTSLVGDGTSSHLILPQSSCFSICLPSVRSRSKPVLSRSLARRVRSEPGILRHGRWIWIRRASNPGPVETIS